MKSGAISIGVDRALSQMMNTIIDFIDSQSPFQLSLLMFLDDRSITGNRRKHSVLPPAFIFLCTYTAIFHQFCDDILLPKQSI